MEAQAQDITEKTSAEAESKAEEQKEKPKRDSRKVEKHSLVEKTALFKLSRISARIAVPKAQMAQNPASGQKFAYRSAEDILQAIKPLAEAEKAVVVLQDDLVDFCDSPFMKSTARIISTEDGSAYETHAYAAMKGSFASGMNPAQLTGVCASYARKYALCALFGIGSGEDADSINRVPDVENAQQHTTPSDASAKSRPAPTGVPSKTFSMPQNRRAVSVIRSELQKCGMAEAEFATAMGGATAKTLDSLSDKQLAEILPYTTGEKGSLRDLYSKAVAFRAKEAEAATA